MNIFILEGGPSGRLDFVLRALRALRTGDPRNDVVVGREDDRNGKKIVKKSKNCVEKCIKIAEKTKKYHGQIQKLSQTNPNIARIANAVQCHS